MNKPPGFTPALVACKCPKCRKGDIFTHKAYELRKFMEMYVHCPHCGLKYEIETGFFWGAMYVTYTFTSAFFVMGIFIYFFFLRTISVWYFSLGFVLFIISILPLMVRYSRVVMLYFFASIQFDPKLYAAPQKQ